MPKYNHRFATAAEVEEQLADWYMGSLVNGKVKDHAFSYDPCLVTLQAAMHVMSEE